MHALGAGAQFTSLQHLCIQVGRVRTGKPGESEKQLASYKSFSQRRRGCSGAHRASSQPLAGQSRKSLTDFLNKVLQHMWPF